VPSFGSNQYMTCRSIVNGTPRSASSCGTHAPGQTTSRPAVYVFSLVCTRTPSRYGSQRVTGS
jgi:hypothetical protein